MRPRVVVYGRYRVERYAIRSGMHVRVAQPSIHLVDIGLVTPFLAGSAQLTATAKSSR